MLRAAAICGAALVLGAPASAQNLALRAPAWAQAMVSTDVTPTTGGRSMITAEGIPVSVRVTIAPSSGGVARVIRYDQHGRTGTLAVRRFTGHPSTGWWLWGGDSPRLTQATPAQNTDIVALARAAAGVAGQVGASTEVCAVGEQAFVEIAIDGRAQAQSRPCVGDTDAVGRLVLRLSDIAGSRTEEELATAAVAELLEADRAFAAKAQADGAPAAFNAYAAEDALMASADAMSYGRAGVAQHFQSWPDGARLEWTPQAARVSTRGDMGWTWGNSVYTAPDGTRSDGRYISVWTRDYEGNWRFAFDAAVR